MQSLQDLQDKLFFECKNILESVSKISTQEELLVKHDLLIELTDRINILKYLEKNRDFFSPTQFEEPQNTISEISVTDIAHEDLIEEIASSEVEEEVLFNNELNEIHPEDENYLEIDEEKVIEGGDFDVINYTSPIEDKIELDENKTIDASSILKNEEKESNSLEVEPISEISFDKEDEKSSEIVLNLNEELSSVEVISNISEELVEQEVPVVEVKESLQQSQEKKFKLANIKNVKSVQSLFDDDMFEPMRTESTSVASKTASVVTSTPKVVESSRTEFKLDLNDKIAFSRTLFGGSQTEMNEAIKMLNSCDNLEQAKEYLSDLYYDRNWKKVDDYAQRLWSLVENKFN